MSTQRQSSNQGFLETCIGVIFVPLPTMRTIVRSRPIGWALIVIVVISVAQGIAGAASLDPADFDDAAWLQGPLQGFSIVGGPALAIVGRRLLHGNLLDHESYPRRTGIVRRPLRRLWGSPTCPPCSPFPSPSWPSNWTPSVRASPGFIGFGIAVWTIILSVFAVQASNNFSTGRAIAALLIPLAVLFVLLIAFIAFAFVVIVIAVNQGFSQ